MAAMDDGYIIDSSYRQNAPQQAPPHDKPLPLKASTSLQQKFRIFHSKKYIYGWAD